MAKNGSYACLLIRAARSSAEKFSQVHAGGLRSYVQKRHISQLMLRITDAVGCGSVHMHEARSRRGKEHNRLRHHFQCSLAAKMCQFIEDELRPAQICGINGIVAIWYATEGFQGLQHRSKFPAVCRSPDLDA
jgi:hypothetical protein